MKYYGKKTENTNRELFEVKSKNKNNGEEVGVKANYFD